MNRVRPGGSNGVAVLIVHARRSDRPRSGRRRGRGRRGRCHAVSGSLESESQSGAQHVDGAHKRHGDEGDEECVLNGARPSLTEEPRRDARVTAFMSLPSCWPVAMLRAPTPPLVMMAQQGQLPFYCTTRGSGRRRRAGKRGLRPAGFASPYQETGRLVAQRVPSASSVPAAQHSRDGGWPPDRSHLRRVGPTAWSTTAPCLTTVGPGTPDQPHRRPGADRGAGFRRRRRRARPPRRRATYRTDRRPRSRNGPGART